MKKKTYLGDSVYCEVRNGQIVLTTENGYGASNTIVMEREVLDAFLQFVEPDEEESEPDHEIDMNGDNAPMSLDQIMADARKLK